MSIKRSIDELKNEISEVKKILGQTESLYPNNFRSAHGKLTFYNDNKKFIVRGKGMIFLLKVEPFNMIKIWVDGEIIAQNYNTSGVNPIPEGMPQFFISTIYRDDYNIESSLTGEYYNTYGSGLNQISSRGIPIYFNTGFTIEITGNFDTSYAVYYYLFE